MPAVRWWARTVVAMAAMLVGATDPTASAVAQQPPSDPGVEVRREWFGSALQLSIRETTVRRGTEVVLRSRVVTDPCASRPAVPGLFTPPPPPGRTPGLDITLRVRVCSPGGTVFGAVEVWVHTTDPGLPPVPSVEEVLAVVDLTLDAVAVSPAARQLAGLPTWLWVPAEAWTSRTAVASLRGVVVTAEAVPVQSRWLVDGREAVRCAGPGVPYRPGPVPPDACTVTFTARSPAARVELVVGWQVTIVFPDGSTEVVPAVDGPPAARDLVVVDARTVTG